MSFLQQNITLKEVIAAKTDASIVLTDSKKPKEEL